MPRLVVTINLRELDALVKLAMTELRNPRDQARFLLQQELRRLNLLREDTEAEIPRKSVKEKLDD